MGRQLQRGDVVSTPSGNGCVVYVRMAPPAFTEVEAVSVLLDEPKQKNLNYIGTIFTAKHVTLVAAAPDWL